jgi:hypothetical protein
MIFLVEKDTLKNELTETLSHFERQVETLGIDPDEIVGEFHHSNIAMPAERMRIFNSRKKYLSEREYSGNSPFLSVIR